jgi:hypothetical protein
MIMEILLSDFYSNLLLWGFEIISAFFIATILIQVCAVLKPDIELAI